jgi:hypothetical protein
LVSLPIFTYNLIANGAINVNQLKLFMIHTKHDDESYLITYNQCSRINMCFSISSSVLY